jgi:hypothetical protein
MVEKRSILNIFEALLKPEAFINTLVKEQNDVQQTPSTRYSKD